MNISLQIIYPQPKLETHAHNVPVNNDTQISNIW